MRISDIRQRLRGFGAKSCHEDRLLRGWSQVCSYDRKHSPAEAFFPLALRNELPTIEAELNCLARLRGEYPANGQRGSDEGSATPTLSRLRERGQTREAFFNSCVKGGERERLSINLAGEGANVALHGFSDNEGVARLLVELRDGQMVESVLLPRGGLCVSTQVGCAVGCVFCMSGRDGLLRQLGSAEIVAQVVLARRRRAVSKVVFMGMGEPAHNLDNVLEAIHLLGTQGNIGHKNLVLSTVGDLRVFERLMTGFSSPVRPEPVEGHESVHVSTGSTRTASDFTRPRMYAGTVKPALAISLHTTDATLRARLLPRAPQIAVEELVECAEAYARATSYPTQYQWTLIEGVNDSDAELKRIARLLAGKYAIMNFIPFNEVDGLDYRRPSAERIASMVHALRDHGILAKVRDSAGQEVEGACGQLRARAEKARSN